MSSRYNVILHGKASEAAELLGSGNYNAEELRAGICNALNRISLLEDKAATPVPVRQFEEATT